jgi:hypothetical protein
MSNDALIEQINVAYRRLSAATEDLVRADRELAEHLRRVRLDNAEAILEARNKRCRASTSTACSTPTSIDAWRPTERELISTTST